MGKIERTLVRLVVEAAGFLTGAFLTAAFVLVAVPVAAYNQNKSNSSRMRDQIKCTPSSLNPCG